MNSKYKTYIESQARAAMPVTNDDLVCGKCYFKNEDMPTAFCNVFTMEKGRKPNSVLLGGKCPYFRKVE